MVSGFPLTALALPEGERFSFCGKIRLVTATTTELWTGGPTIEGIRQAIAEGYISLQSHASLPLQILNYTHKAQFSRTWTLETRSCRGLIVDSSWQVIQRPFSKFFNWEEHEGDIPAEPFEVFEKLDGSLGILYHDPYNGPALATRGSFHSMQARRGTEILRDRYAGVAFNPSLTYLFEIIVPENRIVVDYGAREDVVLLAIIDTATGRDVPIPPWDVGVPVVERYDGISDVDELLTQDRENHEGYVVRFASGLRLKIKHEEYVRLHRLVTGVTPRKVWERLRDGLPVEKFLVGAPGEYQQWVQNIAADLSQRFREIEGNAAHAMLACPDLETRREIAEYIKACDYPHVMFAMLDEKDLAPIIWKLLYPAAGRPFRVET